MFRFSPHVRPFLAKTVDAFFDDFIGQLQTFDVGDVDERKVEGDASPRWSARTRTTRKKLSTDSGRSTIKAIRMHGTGNRSWSKRTGMGARLHAKRLTDFLMTEAFGAP